MMGHFNLKILNLNQSNLSHCITTKRNDNVMLKKDHHNGHAYEQIMLLHELNPGTIHMKGGI